MLRRSALTARPGAPRARRRRSSGLRHNSERFSRIHCTRVRGRRSRAPRRRRQDGGWNPQGTTDAMTSDDEHPTPASDLPEPPALDATESWALFVDVDGTLVGYAPHPDAVKIDPAT